MLSSDKERAAFRVAAEAVTHDTGIGTLGEKTLHAVIKQYLEPNEKYREVKVESSVADIFNEQGIIEIQTRSYEKLRKKLTALLDTAPVTVVLPLPHKKTVTWVDPKTGESTVPRKSPKTGRPHDGLRELAKIRDFLANPRLTVRIMLIDMEEYRNLDGWGKGGKRGSSRKERIPTELVAEYILHDREDYKIFLPELPDEFTLKEYTKAAKLNVQRATAGLNILRELDVVRHIGKRGRENLYEITVK